MKLSARLTRNLAFLALSFVWLHFGALPVGAGTTGICDLPSCYWSCVEHGDPWNDCDCKEIVINHGSEDPDELCNVACQNRGYDVGDAHVGQEEFCTTTWYAYCGCWDWIPE